MAHCTLYLEEQICVYLSATEIDIIHPFRGLRGKKSYMVVSDGLLCSALCPF